MKTQFATNLFNFSAVILLVLLIAAPIYFANNFAKVAGLKSESPYLLVSQVENFPSMSFIQSQNNYSINFTKQATKQAYLSILIINNPTKSTKTYKLNIEDSSSTLFFGNNLDDKKTVISVPSGISVPISLYSTNEANSASVRFSINSN